jgi:hypothetical protein
MRFKTDSTKERLGFTAIWHKVLKCEWICLQCVRGFALSQNIEYFEYSSIYHTLIPFVIIVTN